MRTLIVGSWVTETYEVQLFKAFQKLSYDVHAFKWGRFFNFSLLSNKFDSSNSIISSIYYRFQNKFIIGPAVSKLNSELINTVNSLKPDLIFLYRAILVRPKTLKIIKEMNITIIVYNNDDPFTTMLPKYIYKNFLSSLEFADWIFSYRKKNIIDYKNLGFENTSILRSSYSKSVNYKINNSVKEYDIIFIGHFEEDGRDELLMELINLDKYKVGIWGPNWRNSKYYNKFTQYLQREIKPLYGSEYNVMINNSKIALVFLSKINSDGYTRRCFEIPAAETLMLCEYSPQISKMYEDKKEAIFFTTKDELISKTKRYLEEPNLIKEISIAGRRRLLNDGHEIEDRAKEIIKVYNKLKNIH